MTLLKLVSDNTERARITFTAIVKSIVILSVCYALYFHLWRILFINLLLLFLIFLPTILKNKLNVHLPYEFDIILFLFVILSFFLGALQGLIVQIFFGLAVGFVGFALMLLMYRNSKIKINFLFVIMFSTSFSLALGSLSELGKFYLKQAIGYQVTTSDYYFAMFSLTLVLFGTLIASGLGYSYVKGTRIWFLETLVERFKKKNPRFFVDEIDSQDELVKLIKKGESERLEFKATMRTNMHTKNVDKNVETACLKTVVAFLNSGGGTLLIGVTDNGAITGIENDHFQNADKFSLHFTNLIKEHVGNEFRPYLAYDLVEVGEKKVLRCVCSKSEKPVFLKYDKNEEFFIRVGPASIKVMGSKLVDYIKHNF